MLLVDDDRTVLDASGTVIDSEDFEAASQTVTGCRRVSQQPVDTPQKRLSRLSAKTANAEHLMNQENAFPLGNAPFEDERSIVIELEAHDMSRFEWRVAVPLPVHEYLNYTVQAEFELPSISTLSPSPWDQLQGFTRLEEPQVVGASADSDATVHLIRQQVLVLEQMLQRARQGVLRHCRLVCEQPGDRVAVESLITWLDTAFRALAAARARAVAGKSTDSAELERERILADEFISVRLIDPLNPESGATLRVTLVNHVHRGAIAPQPQLAAAGVRHVRQLFRYDLTPLCTRLHDPIKSIPMLDADHVFVSIWRLVATCVKSSETTLRDTGN